VINMDTLTSTAISVVMAEEIARKLLSTTSKPRETRVIRIADAVSDTAISEDGSGKLIELVVISDSREYSVSITIDNATVMDGSFDWYQSVSQYTDWIDAFEDNGSFVLRITDLSFSSSIKISLKITSQGSIKFREIIAKIEKY